LEGILVAVYRVLVSDRANHVVWVDDHGGKRAEKYDR
jgi:hypothetical protein